MKKEVFVLIIACLFIINCLCFVYGASTSGVPVDEEKSVIDKSVPIAPLDANYIGKEMGFKNEWDFYLTKDRAEIKDLGDGKKEVILKEGGVINAPLVFDGPNVFDFSKPVRFVFKEGKLIEANFEVNTLILKTQEKQETIKQGAFPMVKKSVEGFTINGDSKIIFPVGSKVSIKNEVITAELTKEGEVLLDISPTNLLLSNLKGKRNMELNYIITDKSTDFIMDVIAVSIEKGGININKDNQVKFIGEEIIFGELNTKKYDNPLLNYNLILNNMKLKNPDPESGISLSKPQEGQNSLFVQKYSKGLGLYFYGSKTTIPDSYDFPKSMIHYDSGYLLTVSSAKEDNEIELSFNPGNPVFNNLKENQYISIATGEKQNTNVYFTYNFLDDSKRAEYILAGEGSKIDNSGTKYEFKKIDNKLQLMESRSSTNEQYPVEIIAEDINLKTQSKGVQTWIKNTLELVSPYGVLNRAGRSLGLPTVEQFLNRLINGDPGDHRLNPNQP